MAINVSFGGQTIYRPGAFSQTTVDVGGGFPIGPAGLVAVIGEADAGAPGSAEIDLRNNGFTADQMPTIRNKYRSGPIVDAAAFLFAPAADAVVTGGAQIIWIYKTNASTQSSLALATAYGTVKSREWGVGGNRCVATITQVNEVAPSVTGAVVPAFGAPLDSASIEVAANGVKATLTLSAVPADHADIATLVAELSALITAEGLPLVVTNVANALKIDLAADATIHRKGYGRSFEIFAGADLALLGLVASSNVSSVEPSQTIKIEQKRDLIAEEETVGGNIILKVGHDGTGAVTAAKIDINATKIILTPTPGSPMEFDKASYVTLLDLAEEINRQTGWSAALTDAAYNQLSPDVLDQVANVGAMGSQPARIKKDAADVASFFEMSGISFISGQSDVGLPDVLAATNFAGGSKGGTTGLEITNALEKFTKFHVNFIVPLFSRDATADLADGLTESTSTYTIDAIHQAVKTHISLMKSVKKKSERQGYLSLKRSYADSKTQAGVIADGRCQLVIQDVRQVNAQGNIIWFQPWALACLLAGSRCGAPIGEPMTFKFANCSGIRHTAQPMSTAEADIVVDFDADLQGDDAIQRGITFLESRQGGGFRWVVDNTTYGRDGNFVWNRGNVIYAADVVAFNLRQGLEDVFVGRKNTVTTGDVTSVAANILGQARAQGLTVSTSDAPNGYRGLQARIVGNTIFVDVVIKIVEGLDFVLANLSIERAVQ